jgi:peptidoglycan/LPS O-acetylase OafA/YrhL
MSSISSAPTAPTSAKPGTGVRAAEARLAGLQALRGLAAMLVVLLHASQMAGLFDSREFVLMLAGRLSAMGYFGVDVFFVLSGVVISILLRRNAVRPERPAGFLIRRAAKLLPTFWVTLTLMVLLPAGPDAANGIGQFAAQPLSLVLLATQSAHPVAWTLIFEAHFYIITAVALCLGARREHAMLCWVALQVTAVGLTACSLLPRLMFLSPLSLELCAGLLIGRVAMQLPMRAPGVVALAVFTIMLGASAVLPIYGLTLQHGTRLVVSGIPAMLLVYAVLSLDAAGWRPPRLALRLGEISYSLYMWHIVVLTALATVMSGWLATWPGAVTYWGLGIGLSLLVAQVAYRVIEAPATEWANRATRGRVGRHVTA